MPRLATLAWPRECFYSQKERVLLKLMKDVKQPAGYQDPEYLREEMGPKLEAYSFGVVTSN